MPDMDTIDSRDLLDELRDLLDEPSYDYNDEPEAEALNSEDRERVHTLRDLLRDLPEATVDGCNSYGCTLIAESYFETYARELADDIGAFTECDGFWPYTCIDWAKAAEELAQDYTVVELAGVTYLAR